MVTHNICLSLTYFTKHNIRCIHTVQMAEFHSILWPCNIQLYIEYIIEYIILFVHSSVDGYLGCVHILALVNSAAVNIGV